MTLGSRAVGDRWDRLEVSHEPCYLAAGEPYGQATA